MRAEIPYETGHNQPPPPFVIRPQPDLSQSPALIFPRQRLERSAGTAKQGEWVLRFERRSPPFLEPLMGWTGCDDPLAQIELTFPSRMEAIRHAEREGLAWRAVDEPPSVAGRRRRIDPPVASGGDEAVAATLGVVVSLSSLQATYGSCHLAGVPELDKALVNPAAVFGSPDEVVRHPLLTLDCKREVLWRWAWDEYLLELAAAEGMPESEPSRLPEVKAALRVLGTEWSPDPAAPAAFVVRYDQHGMRAAA